MPLKKPPLLEIWMSFRFEPAPGAPAWSNERYKLFLDAVAKTHPTVEQMIRRGIRVEKSRRGGKPKVTDVVNEVMAVRALTDDGLRIVQLWPDTLIANYLRREAEPYPGFDALLDEALSHLRQYQTCYSPLGVVSVALHYVDEVAIPREGQAILRTEEYLTLNVVMPEKVFGAFSAFDINAILQPPGGADPIQVGFASAGGDETQSRFRLEWHTESKSASRMNEEEVRSRLGSAHERLSRCFQRTFTEKGWALFEPDEP
jgi:uncharacterized protein (TIGR04255 family)